LSTLGEYSQKKYFQNEKSNTSNTTTNPNPDYTESSNNFLEVNLNHNSKLKNSLKITSSNNEILNENNNINLNYLNTSKINEISRNNNLNINNKNFINTTNQSADMQKEKSKGSDAELEISKTWIPEEDEILINYVKTKKKKNWKELSKILKNKSTYQCIYRYKKLYKELNFKKWTKNEDIQLLDLIENHGKNWSLFATSFFPNRTPDEIEERYYNKLNPNLKHSNFDPEEDQLIIELYSKYGNKWNEIAKHFKDRNAAMIKNRYYSHIKKKKLNNNINSSKGKSHESETITETSSFTSLSGNEQNSRQNKNNGFFLSNSSIQNNSNSNSGNSSNQSGCLNNNNESHNKLSNNPNNFFFGNNISYSNNNSGSDNSGNSSRINIFQKNQMINFNSNYDFDYNINMNLEQEDREEKVPYNYNLNANNQYNIGINNNKNILNNNSNENNFNVNNSNISNRNSSINKSIRNDDTLNLSNNFNLNQYKYINNNIIDNENMKDNLKSKKSSSFNENFFNISNIMDNNHNKNFNDLKEIEMNIIEDKETNKNKQEEFFFKNEIKNLFDFNQFEYNNEFDLDRLLLDFDKIDKLSNDSFSNSYDILLDNEMNFDLNNLYSINSKNIFQNLELNDLKKLNSSNLNYKEELNINNKDDFNIAPRTSNRSSIDFYNNSNLSNPVTQKELINYSDNYPNNYFLNKILGKNNDEFRRKFSDINFKNVKLDLNTNLENQNKKGEDEENKINLNENSNKNTKRNKLIVKRNEIMRTGDSITKKQSARKINSLKTNNNNSIIDDMLKDSEFEINQENFYLEHQQKSIVKSPIILNECKSLLRSVSYDEREFTYFPKEYIKFQDVSRRGSNKSQNDKEDNFHLHCEKIFCENKSKFNKENFDSKEDELKQIEYFNKNKIVENFNLNNFNFIENNPDTNFVNFDKNPHCFLENKFQSLEKILNYFMEYNSKQIKINEIPVYKTNEKKYEKYIKAETKINEKRDFLINKLVEVQALYNKEMNKNSNFDFNSKSEIIRNLEMQINILIKLINATKIKISIACKLEKYLAKHVQS